MDRAQIQSILHLLGQKTPPGSQLVLIGGSALSKVERGFDTDFDDLIFLIHGNWVDVGTLEQVTRSALVHAREFDMDTIETLAHLEELKRRLK